MHPALSAVRSAIQGSTFEDDLWIVGGAVRDEVLGLGPANDFDLVTRGSSAELARLLFERGVSTIPPVTYERFGTAMVKVEGSDIEIVTARRESYDPESRKPNVEPASYEEDAARRDFTVNTLLKSLSDGAIRDPLGQGLTDLKAGVLRTPLDPIATFVDDPLRMLRAVRFRWKLGFEYAPGLVDAIRESRHRLAIVSAERIRDEWVKMLALPSAPEAMQDLLDLGLLELFAPEFLPMVDCEQGKYHHLDVWRHTLLVLRNAGSDNLVLSLAALLHDVGKPPTRSIDEQGNTRFFSHETVGADMAREMLRRLRFPQSEVLQVANLVKNHMRLGSSPTFSASAARRVLRDLGDQTEQLLQLVEADANGLKAGVKVMDLAAIREKLAAVQLATPQSSLVSPLSGDEIMAITGDLPGPEIGKLKRLLTEQVLDGVLQPGDKVAAREQVLRAVSSERDHPRH